jgi:possible peptide-transporting ATPase
MKKQYLIKQHDIRDCGAACLASVGSYFGVQLPIAHIRQLVHTDKRGTNLMGLIAGAVQYGAPLIALPLLYYYIIYKGKYVRG